MNDKHLKHPPITRSSIHSYHRVEWGIYGSSCDEVQTLYEKINANCFPEVKLAYVDADHSEDSKVTFHQIGKKQFHFSVPLSWNNYDDRLFNWPVDAVFVNGNHYSAHRQIVILNSKKKESLFRRIDQLSKIDLLITLDDDTTVYDFLKDKITSETQIYSIHNIDVISEFIKAEIKKSLPPLKALILAGGKSKRMQLDKSQLIYHNNQSQLSYIANLCKGLGIETYISRSHLEENAEMEGFPIIKDSFVNMGPFGAIASGFVHDPNAAYLVIACDLALIDQSSIQYLLENRDASKHATAYKLKDQRFPEPLIAIYEPKIYQRMLRLFSLGYACPRKVLINSDVEILAFENEQAAFNANTPEERELAIKLLNQ